MNFFDIRPKIIDRYIIRKFIGTYFFILVLLILIVIVFDFTEKIGKLLDNNAPTHAIIFDYYLNFIPYFVNMYSPLFVFVTVIFFTSRMAYNTEIIAILSNGISFKRMMYPFMLSAFFIALLSLVLNLFIIPPANKHRQEFENTYVRAKYYNSNENIHLQLEPGIFVYMSYYNTHVKRASDFSLERFEGTELKSKLTSTGAVYDTISGKWRVENYLIRDIQENGETIRFGTEMDTTILLTDADLSTRDNVVETMNYFELNDHIEREKLRGSKRVEAAYIEKYNRVAMPFSTFILTIIGVSLSSRKVRGGIGLHIGIGIALSFIYIFLMKFSQVFSGILGPMLAVWMPNILFMFVAAFLYRKAPK